MTENNKDGRSLESGRAALTYCLATGNRQHFLYYRNIWLPHTCGIKRQLMPLNPRQRFGR